MPARRDQAYEEAVALWRALSDQPPPHGDASMVIAAAMGLREPRDYERFQNRHLDDPDIEWAVYRAPPHQA